MFTKVFQRLFGANDVVDTLTAVQGSEVKSENSIRIYEVTIPGQQPVRLRAKNQVEVKAMVREAQGLSRLPAGTTVDRVN